ncbi:MAG: sensor signal transduction histidine kinase [Myxococcaceae bacterium]|nr:sensor signal transduction histidine kinase [Myxococcaceae bacterium]
MTNDSPQAEKEECAVPASMRLHVESAMRSQVPIAITRGSTHRIHYVNTAFAHFIGCPQQQLVGQCMGRLSREPERMDALIERACHACVTELSPDLAYVCPDGSTLFGATVVQPIAGLEEPGAVVLVIDTTMITHGRSSVLRSSLELKQANEQLLLASLREHDLADRAADAKLEVERLLHRKSVLAEASTLLSASLELERTLDLVTRLMLPELADGCILHIASEGTTDPLRCAHVDPEQAQRWQARAHELRNDRGLSALIGRALASGQPEVCAELPLACEPLPGPPRLVLHALSARALLAVPLEARGSAIGVLVLVSCSAERRFEPMEIELAVELGRRGSAAIDNARLYHEAQRALRMREDVLAIVSHDLRNPLSAISMSVERLLKHVPAPDPLELAASYELIHRSSKHMRRLIEELLDVASIQSGELYLERAEVSAEAVLGEALDMLRPVAEQQGVILQLHPVDPDLRLHCDLERAVRVIANLVGNAIKFTPRGGSVQVTCTRQGQQVRVDVADTGPGIQESELPRLFEQYWKGEQTGRTGMGLGLYIARGIVEAHGGRIWVESHPPHGSTFSFTLQCVPPLAC